MIKSIKYVFLILMVILLSSNISQPGIYNAGGTSFSMLFPEDSLSYKKVQMQEEYIYIQLYKGFAVVKGEYRMINTSPEKIHFTIGYPIRGIYNGGEVDLNQVHLDSLYKFKVLANGRQLPINEVLIGDKCNAQIFKNENWLTWDIDFTENETKMITVYFLVNTNNAQISKGYTKEKKNAFIYLLESGSVWKQPIESGKFIIELKGGLNTESISGISYNFNFRVNERNNVLIGNKSNFTPTPEDNLVITYHKYLPDFNFQLQLNQSELYFTEIDSFSKQNFTQNLSFFEAKSPYEVQPDFWSFLPALIFYFVIAIPFILGFVFFLFIYKFLRNRKSF